jgi:hypothetical protein
VEGIDAGERDIPQHHAGDELAKHGGLANAHTDVSGDLRGSENDSQCEKNLRHRIRRPVGCVLSRSRKDRWEKRYRGETNQETPSDGSRSRVCQYLT